MTDTPPPSFPPGTHTSSHVASSRSGTAADATSEPLKKHAPAPTKKRLVWPITSAIIIIVLASALAYVIYLANQWSVYGKEVNAHAHTMGVEIAQLESELSSAENQLDAAQEQLSTAQSRITELASEKALVGDDRETQRLLAEDTAAIATEALGVSSDLASCVTRQTRVLNAVSSIQSTQNDLLTERSKPSKDQDSEVLAQLDESLQEEQNKLAKASEVAEETCQGATERYTTLVEDLES